MDVRTTQLQNTNMLLTWLLFEVILYTVLKIVLLCWQFAMYILSATAINL